jgi:hypothetical protein
VVAPILVQQANMHLCRLMGRYMNTMLVFTYVLLVAMGKRRAMSSLLVHATCSVHLAVMELYSVVIPYSVHARKNAKQDPMGMSRANHRIQKHAQGFVPREGMVK